MLERLSILYSMNRLSVEQRVRVIAALVDGVSIRATCRMTGVAKNTVVHLLEDVGAACLAYQQKALVNLPCKRVQCDEIWSFIGMKASRTNAVKRAKGMGDIWTWTALDADTKLVPAFFVGDRSGKSARAFLGDLESRLANRVQLTTDGFRSYLFAVEDVFGWNGVDYAMLDKIYGAPIESERRYSPAVVIGTEVRQVMGNPDSKHISTSYVERSNLTMRMGMRRFTRLTNAFSKKIENHAFAVSLHFMYYNFCRSHTTLTKANKGVLKTPAMAAGVSDHVWKIEEIVALLAE
jgi:IS1 family transposase